MKYNYIGDMCDQEILDYLTAGLTIRNREKDHYGEVFTPPDLIAELLDALPATVWKNPNTRWLDPAAGRGNFSAMVYLRLLKSLREVIPNIQDRIHHILQNMLFMVEINPKLVHELRGFFGQRANISLADFLDQPEKWGRDLARRSFDVILGNPPFQSAKVGAYEGSAGNRTLWDAFIKTGLHGELLVQDGYLAFITPPNWRRPDHPLYDLMTKQNHLLYLHIYGKKAGLQWFHVQSRFDAYIVQKGAGSPRSPKCTVIDEEGKLYAPGKIDPRSWPFLPNYHFQAIHSILAKSPKRRIPVVFSSALYDARTLSKRRTAKNRYPIVHGITQRGLGIRYAQDRKTTQFGIPKVLLNFNERQYPYNDFQGKYGMSQLTFGIPISSKSQGEAIIRAINSPAFQDILRATKWSAFQTDYRMFTYFDVDFYKRAMFRENTASLQKTQKRRK